MVINSRKWVILIYVWNLVTIELLPTDVKFNDRQKQDHVGGINKAYYMHELNHTCN
jgi:hypothetical protein